MSLADGNSIYAPGIASVNIEKSGELRDYISNTDCLPDVIVNAAAFTNNRFVPTHLVETIGTNIIGAANVAQLCIEKGIDLVYISTDYVYGDDKNYHHEDSPLLPANDYAWTKLGGECSARLVPDHLIIRTSFGHSMFPYDDAFINLTTNKGYIEDIAPLIMNAITSEITGTINIGFPAQNMYEYAKKSHPGVSKAKATEPPYNVTMSLHRMEHELMALEGKEYTEVTRCRACHSHNLHSLVDLGLRTLPNKLCDTAEESLNLPKYPLEVLKCTMCHMIQLSSVVEPSEMFTNYPYRSGMSKTYKKHCQKLAEKLDDRHVFTGKNDLVVDIAGNDGTLLDVFHNTIGVRVVNIEPAGNLADISERQEIPVISQYWGPEAATELLAMHGRPKVITATNVLAHVDDLDEFFSSCHTVMGEESILIIEVPYAVDMIERNEFDTIYHEHLSYFLLYPLLGVAKRNNMRINDVESLSIHGGTMRLYISRIDSIYPTEKSVKELLDTEVSCGWHDNNSSGYTLWPEMIYKEQCSIENQVSHANKNGQRVMAFAASAKGAMMLQAADINCTSIQCIIDDTPEKVGKFMPGTGIPIIDRQEAFAYGEPPPTTMVILSWNFAEEIKNSLREQFHGKYIIPIIGDESS